jgi:hypothetical protein
MQSIWGPNGYQVLTDGECYTIKNDLGMEVFTYHPLHGSAILGHQSPKTVVALLEDFKYASKLISQGQEQSLY